MIRLVTEVKSKPEWCKLTFIYLKMSGTILSGFFYSMIYTVQNNLKPKYIKLISSPPKMQQVDKAQVTEKRGAWKWVLYPLFRQRCNTENNRHEYWTSKHHLFQLYLNNSRWQNQSILTYRQYTGKDWGIALQTGRSRFRFPKVSLEFFIDTFLPAALWPCGWIRL